MKVMRGVILAAAMGGLAIAAPAMSQAPAGDVAAQPLPANPLVEQGRYLAVLGDCEACHTRPGGVAFSGGLAMNTPFGTIYSANITPDKATGIGGWTKAQFRRAMKHGKDNKGRNLYPAFSYPYYARVKTADVDAIYAYIQSLPATSYTPPKNKMGFPFNVRVLVTFWNWIYLRTHEYKPDPKQSAEWNRGAYLVTGLGHCGACHTPKSPIGGDRNSRALQGGRLDNWLASDLTGDRIDGLGSWSQQDIVDFLKTGMNNRSSAYGSMIEVVRFSTSKMTDADLNAIAIYLKSLPAPKGKPRTWPKPPAAIMARGKAVYDLECQVCHMPAGEGIPGGYPGLAGNANIRARDAVSLTHILLTGSRTAHLEPLSADPMPGFAEKLTDADAAAVLTYIRNSWGNSAPIVKPRDVTKMRAAVRAAPAPKPAPAPAAPPAK